MLNKYTALLVAAMLFSGSAFAGNPDRQGEAGANQLLINPWARSAGFHTLNTSTVSGAEAAFLNIAGLARVEKTEILISHTRYLVGSDINLNALGLAQRVGKNGAFGINLVSFDLGDFDLTEEGLPEGSGATFSPSFFNLGLSYSHLFANKVSVGVTVKFVNESLSNVRASAACVDAGVQYVTGENDNFKFGISLRNVGTKMVYRGEGLTGQRPANNPTFEYPLQLQQRPAAFELPSQLNIGLSYDWIIPGNNRLTLLGNFTSNAFSRDVYGAGLEFALGKIFALRAAYKLEFDAPQGSTEASVDNGLAAGLSIALPLKKDSNSRISLDYAYRATTVFEGLHNLAVRINL